MNAAKLRFFAQLWILVAIIASTALLMDSLGSTPAYCGGAGGCLTAKRAARDWLGPVPLPLLGMLSFAGLLVITASTRTRVLDILEYGAALVGAVGGTCLLLAQAFVLKTFCPFCVVVDISAIAVFLILMLARRRAHRTGEPLHFLSLPAWLGLGVVAIVAPAVWPYFRPASRVPADLAEFQQPNRVSIVEFVDLQCSHCRALHATMEELRHRYADRIHFVRLHAPLRAHRVARLGARLIACLDPDQARIELMNRSLFDGPEINQASLEAAAAGLGLSEAEVEGCWNDPSNEALVDSNLQRLERLGFEGLPTTYVGGERIVGAMPLVVYAAAIDRASRSDRMIGLESTAFFVLVTVLVTCLVWLGRRTQPQTSSPRAAVPKC